MSITSIITRSLSESAIVSGMKDLNPDRIDTFSVAAGCGDAFADSDPYFNGVRFHAFLRRIADHGPLNRRERDMLPWLNCLRSELRAIGVKHLDPCVRYTATGELPSGEPDLVVSGGLMSRGVVEVKVTRELPARPLPEHLLQLGGYVAHELTTRPGNVWAAVAYVSFRDPKIRLFLYRDTQNLARTAHGLLSLRAA